MISKGSTACFLYITLPGETESVTAGRFELTKDRRGNALAGSSTANLISRAATLSPSMPSSSSSQATPSKPRG